MEFTFVSVPYVVDFRSAIPNYLFFYSTKSDTYYVFTAEEFTL